jgi:hypothetical protein
MTTAPATAGNSAGSQAATLLPFRGGTQPTLTSDGYVNSVTLSSSAQDMPVYNPSPNNLLRALFIQVVATTASNTATVAFNGDMPLGIFSSMTFQDANEKPIIGPFDSYTLAMINKYGGYDNNGDIKASAAYSIPSLSGGTGGSFTETFRVPIEAVTRTGVGSLQNQSSNSTFQLKMTVTTSALVYQTAPAGASGAIEPTVKVTIYESGYWKGANASYSQIPKAAGSTQYWTRGSYTALNGAIQQQLSQGLGYPIRNILEINYATGGARDTTHFPSPVQYIFKGSNLWNVNVTQWQDQMSRAFDLQSETADVANGIDSGVFCLPFDLDFTNTPGAEAGLNYLQSDQGDLFQIIGSWGASCTLYHVVNYIAPVGPASVLQARAQ